MKRLAACFFVMLMLSSIARAGDDQKPNASNVNKYPWGMHIDGSKSSYGVFVLFSQQACEHKYTGKLKGAEKFQLRKAAVYKDEGGSPGKPVGLGCWSANEDTRKNDYLGYKGDFNADATGSVLSMPWSDMFNANNAN